jgi:hypothetical protein
MPDFGEGIVKETGFLKQQTNLDKHLNLQRQKCYFCNTNLKAVGNNNFGSALPS